jgi:hypothetical protein
MPKHPEKRLLVPDRLRKIRPGFSWIDRRFLREGWIDRLGRDEILLYLFLVAVADQRGLSYYGDATTTALLEITLESLAAARARLIELELIAYQPPLYQVLDLGSLTRRAASEPIRIADLLRPPPGK